VAPTPKTVSERVNQLDIPFNKFGVDPYGITKTDLTRALTFFGWLYHHYFSVHVEGIEHIPQRGRAMLVGNHSGGVALDAAMIFTSVFFDMNPPRLAQGMAEKFIAAVPFFSRWTSRTGQFTGLPEHAIRLLEDERLLVVFPEGVRGTAKLYKDRHSLVEFGTGFMRLALKTHATIVPFAFVGGGEAIPTVLNAHALGRLFGAPYVPITPYLFAIPLPVRLEIQYGAPIVFEGSGNEDDEVIESYIGRVKHDISKLIEHGVNKRRQRP